MNDKSVKAVRCAAGWCIAMGVVSVAAGLAVGVGCLVAGGKLKGAAKRLAR